jgi:hypothetical protein
MNTNRFLAVPHRRRSHFGEASKIFWAATSVFTGVLLAVLYCLLTNQIPV